MNNKYKEAFRLAEQDIEEKTIEQLKQTVKAILQKKRDLEEKRNELDEEIKLLKQDIEDFKNGRLDKVKERHETDEKADNVFPITINIIKQEIISKPWTWTYEINPSLIYTTPTATTVSLWNGTTLATASTSAMYLTGNTAQTYTSGTYTVAGASGSSIINL